MPDITYEIQFFSAWHCGSGLSAGADVDALVIRDEHQLPYIPGRTLKGLLRDAAEALQDLGQIEEDAIHRVFGVDTEKSDAAPLGGSCYFSNAELSGTLKQALVAENQLELIKLLFRSHAATAIDEHGQASEHSLRRTETVIPLALSACIADVPPDELVMLEMCMGYIKRLGANRNRGLGRCDIRVCEEAKR